LRRGFAAPADDYRILQHRIEAAIHIRALLQREISISRNRNQAGGVRYGNAVDPAVAVFDLQALLGQ
jgi:hypothetical protein